MVLFYYVIKLLQFGIFFFSKCDVWILFVRLIILNFQHIISVTRFHIAKDGSRHKTAGLGFLEIRLNVEYLRVIRPDVETFFVNPKNTIKEVNSILSIFFGQKKFISTSVDKKKRKTDLHHVGTRVALIETENKYGGWSLCLSIKWFVFYFLSSTLVVKNGKKRVFEIYSEEVCDGGSLCLSRKWKIKSFF